MLGSRSRTVKPEPNRRARGPSRNRPMPANPAAPVAATSRSRSIVMPPMASTGTVDRSDDRRQPVEAQQRVLRRLRRGREHGARDQIVHVRAPPAPASAAPWTDRPMRKPGRRERPRGAGRHRVAPQVHARRAAGQRDVEPVVHDDARAGAAGDGDRVLDEPRERPRVEIALADLDRDRRRRRPRARSAATSRSRTASNPSSPGPRAAGDR